MRFLRTTPLLFLCACVTEHVPVDLTVPGSFRVELLAMDPFTRPAGCEVAPAAGTAKCPRPFPQLDTPFRVRIRVTALNRMAAPMTSWGDDLKNPKSALVDVRPGEINNAAIEGMLLSFEGGVAEADLEIISAYGSTRIWVEDCGSAKAPQSFATGVSDALYFASPRIAELNATADNTMSPMEPRANNACVISGDPRYHPGIDENGQKAYLGYSHGGRVNAPPPAMGTFVDIRGCTRNQYDEDKCNEGPIVVTAVGNEGFYATDLAVRCSAPLTQAACTQAACSWETPAGGTSHCAPAFNHIYAFTFNYPEDLEVGDLLTSLRGSPVEFAGTTQLGNPTWERDGERLGRDLLPKPVHIEPAIYAAVINQFGGNRSQLQDLEKLEGGLVCMDNLTLPSATKTCDVNESGGIERQGCLLEGSPELPPRCEEGMGLGPVAPYCEELEPFCMPLTEEELTSCSLTTYLPSNPAEYCCERSCYVDPTCSESSGYILYGQWSADVTGLWDAGEVKAVKISIMSREANPDFDPFAEGVKQRAKLPEERQTVRVIGNLRQVLAARPVWVITARTPADIQYDKSCP